MGGFSGGATELKDQKKVFDFGEDTAALKATLEEMDHVYTDMSYVFHRLMSMGGTLVDLFWRAALFRHKSDIDPLALNIAEAINSELEPRLPKHKSTLFFEVGIRKARPPSLSKMKNMNRHIRTIYLKKSTREKCTWQKSIWFKD